MMKSGLSSLADAAKRVSVRPKRPNSTASKHASTTSSGTSTSGSDMYSIPSSPLAILLAGGRAVRMEGFLKEKGVFGWRTKFVCLEEGRLRMSRNDEEDDEAPAGRAPRHEVFNLVDVDAIRYSKRGAVAFSVVLGKRTIRLRAGSGEEAEAWVQHVLQEMKNQAQLLAKCATLLSRNGQEKGLERVLRQVVRLWTLANGEVHETVAGALDALADYLSTAGREQEAKAYHKRAEIMREDSGLRGIKTKRAQSNRRHSNAGLEELQVWLDLQSRAEESADVLARTEQLRKREKELIDLMSSQHQSRVEELQNKALQAEERARQAEERLRDLEASKKEALPAEGQAAHPVESLGNGKPRRSSGLALARRLSRHLSRRLSRSSATSGGAAADIDNDSADLLEMDSEHDDAEPTIVTTPFPPPRRRSTKASVTSLAESLRSASLSSRKGSGAMVAMPMPDDEAFSELEELANAAVDGDDEGEGEDEAKELELELEEDETKVLEEGDEDDDEEELTEEERRALAKAQRKRLKKLKKLQKSRKKNESVHGSLQSTLRKGDGTRLGGCYLVMSERNEGMLTVHWSMSPVSGAIGRFLPGENVSVPKFKYTHNEGRQELVRGFMGPGGRKKYFEGVVQYLKLAYEFQSIQVVISGGLVPARVFMWRDNLVQQVTLGSAFSIYGCEAVAVIGENNTSFEGVQKMQLSHFVVVSCQAGHGLTLSSGQPARD